MKWLFAYQSWAVWFHMMHETSGPKQLKIYSVGSEMYKAAITLYIINLWTRFRPAKFDNDKFDKPGN